MTAFTVYAMLIAVGVVGAIGDATLNHWAKSNRIVWLLVSYLIWIGVASLFGVILKWERFQGQRAPLGVLGGLG